MDNRSKSLVAFVLLVTVVVMLWPSEPADDTNAGGSTPAAVEPAPVVVPAELTAAASPASVVGPAPVAQREEVHAAADSGVPFMRVRVLDRDQQPISGATCQTFEDTTPGKVIANADGWCTLPVRAEGKTVRLLVTGGNRHWQRYVQRLPEQQVWLRWAGRLRGHLVDDDTGYAIAGASLERPHNHCKMCEPARTTSAANGTFEFADVPRDEPCTMTVDAAGYPRQDFTLELPGRGETVEHTFRLRRGAEIAGRCVDLDDGRPIPGATLRVARMDARTAPDGGFRVLVLPRADGHVDVRFEAQGHLPVAWKVATPQPDATQLYPMPRAGVIAGTVRDQDGAPIEGAEVIARRDDRVWRRDWELPALPSSAKVDESDSPRVLSDAAGRYRLQGVAPGMAYRLLALHPAFDPADGADPMGVPATAVREGATVHLVMRSRGETGTITGRYTFQGVPTAGKITWRGASRSDSGQIEPSGTFRMEGVECGEVTVWAITERVNFGDVREDAKLMRIVQVEAGKELRLQLDQDGEMAVIQGQVRFPDGAPAPHQPVWTPDGWMRVRAQTAADGKYELRVPRSWAYQIQVLAGDGSQVREVLPGATGVDFTVRREGTLRLRAVGDDGKPLGVLWFSKDAVSERFGKVPGNAVPGPDGFGTVALRQGRHVVLAMAPGFAPSLQAVTVDAAPVEVVLRMTRGVAITLTVAEDADPLPPGLSVQLIQGAFHREGVDPRPSSFFRESVAASGGTLSDVGPGRHRLVASDPDFEILPEVIDVTTGGATAFTLRWRRKP